MPDEQLECAGIYVRDTNSEIVFTIDRYPMTRTQAWHYLLEVRQHDDPDVYLDQLCALGRAQDPKMWNAHDYENGLLLKS